MAYGIFRAPEDHFRYHPALCNTCISARNLLQSWNLLIRLVGKILDQNWNSTQELWFNSIYVRWNYCNSKHWTQRLSFGTLPESCYRSTERMLQLHYTEVSSSLAQLVDYYLHFLEMSIQWTWKKQMLDYIYELEFYFEQQYFLSQWLIKNKEIKSPDFFMLETK